MKTVVLCFFTVLVLIVLSSLPARAIEMSAEEIKAFTNESQKLFDQKKVIRVPFDRDYSKDSPLKIKEWMIASFTKEGYFYVVNASEGSRGEILYLSNKAFSGSFYLGSEVSFCAADYPNSPGKSVLVLASKTDIKVTLSDSGAVYQRGISTKDIAPVNKPRLFLKYGAPGSETIQLLIVDEEAVSKMHQGKTNAETVTVELKARKLTASFARDKEFDFRKALLTYRLE